MLVYSIFFCEKSIFLRAKWASHWFLTHYIRFNTFHFRSCWTLWLWNTLVFCKHKSLTSVDFHQNFRLFHHLWNFCWRIHWMLNHKEISLFFQKEWEDAYGKCERNKGTMIEKMLYLLNFLLNSDNFRAWIGIHNLSSNY